MKRLFFVIALAAAIIPAKAQEVDGETLSQRSSAFNVLENLSGTVAGVSVLSTSGRPGGNPMMMIRGIGSLNGELTPLYVVDGVTGVDPSLLNVADIESVKILKDVAATALYGVRGANGVVLITTKSGKSGREGSSVTYDVRAGAARLPRTPWGRMNTAEYLKDLQNKTPGALPHLTDPVEDLFDYVKLGSGSYVLDENGLLQCTPRYDTDWWKECASSSIVQSHNVSVAHSKGDIDVYANGGWQDFQGILTNTSARRLSGTVNASGKINKVITLHGLVSYSRTTQMNADHEGSEYGAIGALYNTPAIIPFKHTDGRHGVAADYPLLGYVGSNPLFQLSSLEDTDLSDYVLGSVGLDFHLAKGLTLTVKGNYSDINFKNTRFSPEGMYWWSDEETGNHAYILYASHVNIANEDYLTYDFTSKDGAVSTSNTLGFSYNKFRNSVNEVGYAKMSTDIFSHYNLGAGTKKVMPMSDYDELTLTSFYLRSDNVFLGRYLLGVTLRADGSPAFTQYRNKFGFFPGVSAGWLVSEENWFGGLKKAVNLLKIHAGYGKAGNMFGLAGTWEDSAEFDAGIDLGLLSDRVRISAGYYDKKTSCSPVAEGTLHNSGFEVTLDSRPVVAHDFTWDLGVIWSSNKFETDIAGVAISDFLPKGEASLVNTFSWKGLSLMVDAAASYGFKVINVTMHPTVPRAENGSFIRLRNILLNYDFKRSVLRDVKVIKGLRAGISAENALLFTGYSGFDPEVASGTSVSGLGIDRYAYPRPAYLTGNITITF